MPWPAGWLAQLPLLYCKSAARKTRSSWQHVGFFVTHFRSSKAHETAAGGARSSVSLCLQLEEQNRTAVKSLTVNTGSSNFTGQKHSGLLCFCRLTGSFFTAGQSLYENTPPSPQCCHLPKIMVFVTSFQNWFLTLDLYFRKVTMYFIGIYMMCQHII